MESSAQNLAVKPRGKLEPNADKVIAMLLAGEPERAVAAAFGASRRGVELFKDRHERELAGVKAAAVEAVKANWISDKVARLEVLRRLADLTLAEVDEHGIVTEQIMLAEDGGPITTRKYRHELVKEARGLLKDAAIEEGQIVSPGVSRGGLTREVIIREYEGVPQDWIG